MELFLPATLPLLLAALAAAMSVASVLVLLGRAHATSRRSLLPVTANKYMAAPLPPLRSAGARRASLRHVRMAMSPAIVGGNFKCNGSKESISQLLDSWDNLPSGVEVVVFPPYVYLDHTRQAASGKVQVGAQNCWNDNKGGAYTGEVSATMLKDAGFEWVIIGHSERRSINGETDELLGLKLRAALDAGLNVIFCVGELLEQRESGVTEEVIFAQMDQMKLHMSDTEWANVVVAYEPVWAIGTGKVATPEQAQDVHKAIRGWVAANVSPAVAADLRIQYGGSVKASNAGELVGQPDINGFLVGGASLQPEFAEIVRLCA